MTKTAPGTPETLEIITPNEIIVKFWDLRMFYKQLWKIEWMENNLSLQKLMFQKFIKKSMSISLQTYDKTVGVHNFGNQY